VPTLRAWGAAIGLGGALLQWEADEDDEDWARYREQTLADLLNECVEVAGDSTGAARLAKALMARAATRSWGRSTHLLFFLLRGINLVIKKKLRPAPSVSAAERREWEEILSVVLLGIGSCDPTMLPDPDAIAQAIRLLLSFPRTIAALPSAARALTQKLLLPVVALGALAQLPSSAQPARVREALELFPVESARSLTQVQETMQAAMGESPLLLAAEALEKGVASPYLALLLSARYDAEPPSDLLSQLVLFASQDVLALASVSTGAAGLAEPPADAIVSQLSFVATLAFVAGKAEAAQALGQAAARIASHLPNPTPALAHLLLPLVRWSTAVARVLPHRLASPDAPHLSASLAAALRVASHVLKFCDQASASAAEVLQNVWPDLSQLLESPVLFAWRDTTAGALVVEGSFVLFSAVALSSKSELRGLAPTLVDRVVGLMSGSLPPSALK
jgi:hypothetical protein